MTRFRAVVALSVGLGVLAACGGSKPAPVRPVQAPRTVDDITGIWRSPQQATLELRRNGTYVLITSVSNALAGDFSMSQGRISFFGTKECGAAEGSYRIQVSSKDRLVLTDPNDSCALRQTQLTADPFAYG